jgi:hypothetical protein
MLVGHFAAAFVAKRIEPKISLGTLAAAWAYWMNRARPAREKMAHGLENEAR